MPLYMAFNKSHLCCRSSVVLDMYYSRIMMIIRSTFFLEIKMRGALHSIADCWDFRSLRVPHVLYRGRDCGVSLG